MHFGDVATLTILCSVVISRLLTHTRTIGGVHFFRLGRVCGSITLMRKTTVHRSL